MFYSGVFLVFVYLGWVFCFVRLVGWFLAFELEREICIESYGDSLLLVKICTEVTKMVVEIYIDVLNYKNLSGTSISVTLGDHLNIGQWQKFKNFSKNLWKNLTQVECSNSSRQLDVFLFEVLKQKRSNTCGCSCFLYEGVCRERILPEFCQQTESAVA